MNQGDKPDLLIYHGPSCLDGFCCRWIVHSKWPDVEAVVGIYGQAPPDVSGRNVLIADFSYPEEVLREMAAVAQSVTVLDHHKTAEHVKVLIRENVIRGVFDLDRSGAGLCYEYVWGSPVLPKLVAHVQDRDLWRFEIPDTQEVTAFLSSLGMTADSLPAWTEAARALDGGRRHEVVPAGAAIIRQRSVDMQTVIDAGARTMVLGGHRVPVCNAPHFWASEIAGALAEGQPFAATYFDLADGQRQFSLRSRGDGLDVSEIAQEYGGGGHRGAAGFTADPGYEGEIDQEDEPLDVIPTSARGGVRVKEG